MNKKSGFTLVEVIFSIAMLSLVAVVILNLFLSSQTLNEKAYDQNMASLMASNAIEKIKAADSLNEQELRVYYTDTWQETKDVSGAAFNMMMSVKSNPTSQGLFHLDVRIVKDNKTLLSYTTSHFIQEGGRP